QGPPGASADSAQVFDFQGDFEADTSGSYLIGLDFDNPNVNLQVQESDLVLVYTLAGVGGTDTAPIPFWSPLPRRYETAKGPFTYNFAYSIIGVLIFIDTDLDITNAPGVTNDQVFRIVVVPGRAVGGRTTGKPLTKADLSKYPVDLNDYNAVVKYFKIKDTNVRKFTK
ncbi:MAG: hypothetical protein M3Q05_10920, partial [Bacteroidota bacterium]|nr:hypothetical protein [Bacteroidota bacterium]